MLLVYKIERSLKGKEEVEEKDEWSCIAYFAFVEKSGIYVMQILPAYKN